MTFIFEFDAIKLRHSRKKRPFMMSNYIHAVIGMKRLRFLSIQT